jgi:hypothetical protein
MCDVQDDVAWRDHRLNAGPGKFYGVGSAPNRRHGQRLLVNLITHAPVVVHHATMARAVAVCPQDCTMIHGHGLQACVSKQAANIISSSWK